jgi:microcystin-dependent protein
MNNVRDGLTYICTASTRPTVSVTGTRIYETDTKREYVWNGTAWELPDHEPVGVVKMFAGSAAPAGYAICNGQTFDRTLYADLFALIGTTFGAGDGTTTFNVPDMRGRTAVGVGQGSGLRNRTRGQTGGAEDATLPSHSHGASSGTESAAHAHSGNTGGQSATHVHAYDIGDRSVGSLGSGSNVLQQYQAGARSTGGASNDHSHAFNTSTESAAHAHGVTVNAAGVAAGDMNMPPFVGLNYIIKTT